jgi:hypothetical protein
VNDPREMTPEECRAIFLAHVRLLVEVWASETRAKTDYDKLEGLAHSILAAIDGCAMGLPAFELVPSPHPDDKQWHADQGEDWWPTDIDIAGDLHSELVRGKR